MTKKNVPHHPSGQFALVKTQEKANALTSCSHCAHLSGGLTQKAIDIIASRETSRSSELASPQPVPARFPLPNEACSLESGGCKRREMNRRLAKLASQQS